MKRYRSMGCSDVPPYASDPLADSAYMELVP
jgi:hypothetical protein